MSRIPTRLLGTVRTPFGAVRTLCLECGQRHSPSGDQIQKKDKPIPNSSTSGRNPIVIKYINLNIIIFIIFQLVNSFYCYTYAYSGSINWSYKSPKGGSLAIVGTYRSDPSLTWFSGTYPGGNVEFKGMIGPSANGQQPTDKTTITTTTSPDPTLSEAVIVGGPGNFSRAELSEGLISLIGFSEYEAPLLSNSNIQLFSSLNLSQWLPNPPPFNTGDTFTFTNGTNPSLPGYIVGTSEITFSPSTGWTTASPFTGNAQVVGVVDGSAVPEPSTLAMAGIATLVLLGYAWRRSTGGARHKR